MLVTRVCLCSLTKVTLDPSITSQSQDTLNFIESGAFFSHIGVYFEYLLGDSWYKGDDMLIMHEMGIYKVPLNMDDLAHKMHMGYHV